MADALTTFFSEVDFAVEYGDACWRLSSIIAWLVLNYILVVTIDGKN